MAVNLEAEIRGLRQSNHALLSRIRELEAENDLQAEAMIAITKENARLRQQNENYLARIINLRAEMEGE